MSIFFKPVYFIKHVENALETELVSVIQYTNFIVHNTQDIIVFKEIAKNRLFIK
jgi:hypothetical protein